MTSPRIVASPESWNHQSAYASLKASAKRFAGLDNARALIRQSRQIRYLRNVQLVQVAADENRAVKESAEIAQNPRPTEDALLVQTA